MANRGKYPQELRERAVWMGLEHGGEYLSEWAALGSISGKLGISREPLRRWVRRTQVDGGLRSGVTTAEQVRLEPRQGILLPSPLSRLGLSPQVPLDRVPTSTQMPCDAGDAPAPLP